MVLWKVRSNVVGNKIEDVLLGRVNLDVIFEGVNLFKKANLTSDRAVREI